MEFYYSIPARGCKSSIIFIVGPKDFLMNWGVQNWFKRDLFGNPKLL